MAGTSKLRADVSKYGCENLCRPYGTRVQFPLYPALKRWAKIFRPSGAGLLANFARFSHRNFENRVHTHSRRAHPSPCTTDNYSPVGSALSFMRPYSGKEHRMELDYYLLKTEPSEYSFADLQRDEVTIWDGVTNPVAVRHLREMEPGARLVIYETGDH